ncbi:MAG: AsmA-like C-terminal region-containing protein [Candidatus Omnitrophica bacterium]|nr:AsmA-like C-terminal region-containing protein [Candidatus Omnitrophota bacterium]MDD5670914.1 AsmA-like C-terminal region-containing protein [Candidatus Omnitrophota bacterium]
MRNVFIILGTLLVVVIVALACFSLLFDLSVLRPQIERSLDQQYGIETRIGYLSVHWGLNFGIGMEGLIVRSNDKRHLLMKSDKAILGIDLKKAFQRKLKIRAIQLIKPEIWVIRNADGSMNWPSNTLFTEPLSASPATGEVSILEAKDPLSPNTVPSKASGWNLKLSELRIEDGAVHYQDDSAANPLKVDVEKLRCVAYQAKATAPSRIRLEGAFFGSPKPNIFLDAFYFPGRDEINFEAEYDNRVVELAGRLTSLTQATKFKGMAKIHQFDLSTIMPASIQGREYVTGIVTAQIEASLEAIARDTIHKEIAVIGTVDIRQGAFKNINFVRGALENAVSIPATAAIVIGQSPPEIAVTVQNNDTAFDILQANFNIQGGYADVDDLMVKHPDYLISAQGEYDIMNQNVKFSGRLVLLEKLAAYFDAKIPEWDSLKNRQGRIVLPFRYLGHIPGASVKPELSVARPYGVPSQEDIASDKRPEPRSETIGDLKK